MTWRCINANLAVERGEKPTCGCALCEADVLRDVLAPFAEAARAHGVRTGKDDLWVSLGVASSAWVRAMATGYGTSADVEKWGGRGRGMTLHPYRCTVCLLR